MTVLVLRAHTFIVHIDRKFLVAALFAFFCLFAVALADGGDSTTVVSSSSVVQGVNVAASPVVVPAGSTTILTADNNGNDGLYNADSVVFLLEVSAAGSLSPFKFFF